MCKKFKYVNLWSWELFNRTFAIHCNETVTELEVRDWIEKSTLRGGSGNYKKDTLKCKRVKVKNKLIVDL